MSPLIDVTNTVVPEIPSSIRISLANSASNEPKSVEKNPAEKESTQITKDTHPLTKCNTARRKPASNKRQKKKSFQKNVCTSRPSPNLLVQNSNSDCRVPPIPCEDLLNYAFQSLNLSRENLKELDISKKKNNLSQEKGADCIKGYKIAGSPSHVGPLSGSVTSIYQCIACGLELSSIDTLTQHLVKHIYEGLNAASWLNNAISALLPPYSSDSTDNTSENNLPVPVATSTTASLPSSNTSPSTVNDNSVTVSVRERSND